MPAQLLGVSRALSVGSLQWRVLLLRVNLLAVQCQPVTNQIQMKSLIVLKYDFLNFLSDLKNIMQSAKSDRRNIVYLCYQRIASISYMHTVYLSIIRAWINANHYEKKVI